MQITHMYQDHEGMFSTVEMGGPQGKRQLSVMPHDNGQWALTCLYHYPSYHTGNWRHFHNSREEAAEEAAQQVELYDHA